MKNWRLIIVLLMIILIGATIISRLVSIQIIKGDFYSALAKGLHKFFEEIKEERGNIFIQDRNGNMFLLATNKDQYFLYASPKEIKNKQEVAGQLRDMFSLDYDLALNNVEKDTLYVKLKDGLTEQEIDTLEKDEIKGIYIAKRPIRYYPHENFASQLIGFLGGENNGQYGIEEYYNEELKGKKLNYEGEEFSEDYLLSFGQKENKGSDLILTLDYNIQSKAEELLRENQEDLKFKNGQIIVLEPQTGRILAMANFPSFNPNQYEKYVKENNLGIFQNSITQKLFEPGSVFKPITMAIGIDKGIITPSTTYVDPGIFKIGGWPIYNYERRIYPGEITMTEVLEKSINTGAVFVQQLIKNSTFLNYFDKFEIFKLTNIDLPEIYSENKQFKMGYKINFATASFGQGIEMTPIELVKAYSAIVNNGKLTQPYVVEKIIKNDELIEVKPKIKEESIISQKTSSQIISMLVSVVDNGFAKKAQVPGYYIGGKTGTAQIAWSALGENKSGYSDETWQTFIGFGPAFNPRFLILVKLENPITRTAEYSAIPIFQKLANYIINYYQIPPDYKIDDD